MMMLLVNIMYYVLKNIKTNITLIIKTMICVFYLCKNNQLNLLEMYDQCGFLFFITISPT